MSTVHVRSRDGYLPVPRILLVRLSSMGDVILTTPLVRALRARHPEAEIAYLTRPGFAPLVADHPAGVEVLTFDPKGESLGSLAGAAAGAAVHPPARPARRDAHPSPAAPGAGATGEDTASGGWRGGCWCTASGTSTATRCRRRSGSSRRRGTWTCGPMGGRPRWGSAPRQRRRGSAWLADRGLGVRRPIAALAPGAAHFTKRWPQEYWEMLSRLLAAQGYDVAVLTGGDFREEGAAIAGAGGVSAASTAGTLGLQETGAILRVGAGSGERRHGAHAPRHGGGDASRGPLRPDGAPIRVLSLPIARDRAGTGARVPAVQRSGRAGVSAGASPLPSGDPARAGGGGGEERRRREVREYRKRVNGERELRQGTG